MAISISLYNHTSALFANAASPVNLASLRYELLNNSATFTATHTAKNSVDNGAAPLTVTITNASPGVVTWTSHGFSAGQAVMFLTSGALPTGLTAGTYYYVIATGLSTHTFQVSATVGGAAVDTSSAGSGTHTGYASGTYEFYGNGWTPGGPTLVSAAVTQAAITDGTSNDAKLSATDITVTAAGGSITGYKALIYDGVTMKPLAFIDFGQVQTAGDTTDWKNRWGANGIFNWTM